MKIDVSADFDQARRNVAALPAALQADTYGNGFIHAARRARVRAKALAPRGSRPALTRAGTPRKRLADSIRAVRIAWHWDGVKVKKSAALVIAEQPHAHLVERGTVRMRARPFLEPSVSTPQVLTDFKAGSVRSFRKAVKRLEAGKLTARERRAFRG